MEHVVECASCGERRFKAQHVGGYLVLTASTMDYECVACGFVTSVVTMPYTRVEFVETSS